MRDGDVVDGAIEPIEALTVRASTELARLPDQLSLLDDPPAYPVIWSDELLNCSISLWSGMADSD